MKKIPIAQATAAQLREFATVHQGLDVDKAATADQIRAKLRQSSYDLDTIDVAEPKVQSASPQRIVGTGLTRAVDSSGRPKASSLPPDLFEHRDLDDEERRLRDESVVDVIIASTGLKGEENPVPVSVNGTAQLIKRGERSTIRWPYYVALMNAKKLVHETDPDGRIIAEHSAPAYQITAYDAPYCPHLTNAA